MKKNLLTGLLFISLFALWSFDDKPSPAQDLMGSWNVKEVHWKTADTTYSIHKTQPGIFMINESTYSIQWVPTFQPRKPFKVLSKPTDEEMKAGFRSVVFNAGTYELTDSTLTATAVIAKVPGFEGGKQFYRYTIEDNKLTLTMFDETYPDGGKPDWFGKFVTEFVMERVE